jgi:hypothetical protein
VESRGRRVSARLGSQYPQPSNSRLESRPARDRSVSTAVATVRSTAGR